MPSWYESDVTPLGTDRSKAQQESRDRFVSEFYETMTVRQDTARQSQPLPSPSSEFLRLFAQQFGPNTILGDTGFKGKVPEKFLSGTTIKPSDKPAEDHEQSHIDSDNKKEKRVLLEKRKDISPEFAQLVEKTIEGIPESVRKLLLDAGCKIVAADTVTAALPELKNQRPRGWPPNMTWDHADGIQVWSKRTIAIAERRMSDDVLKKSVRAAGVLRHEVGHAIDQIIADKRQGDYFCDSPAFQIAFERDLRTISADDRKVLQYHLQNGHAGRSETFADVFALQIGGPCNEEDRDPLTRAFPEVGKLVGTKLKELADEQTKKSK
jgi:hypothetical protein